MSIHIVITLQGCMRGQGSFKRCCKQHSCISIGGQGRAGQLQKVLQTTLTGDYLVHKPIILYKCYFIFGSCYGIIWYDFLEPLFLILLLSLRPFHAQKSNSRVRPGSRDVNPLPLCLSKILPSDLKYPFAVLLNS